VALGRINDRHLRCSSRKIAIDQGGGIVAMRGLEKAVAHALTPCPRPAYWRLMFGAGRIR
jgi:hypothetical protein